MQSRFRGVELTDPYDGAPVRWNPIRRAPKRVAVGSHYLYPNLPGKHRDPATGDYAVDSGHLKREIAPMAVHMLDAYFSSLVIEGLLKRGVRDVLGIHDNWLVPALTEAGSGGRVFPGVQVLEAAIQGAGRAWLEGLGSVYKEFIGYLGDTDDGRWFQQLEADWRARVARQDWPTFAAV